MGFYQACIYEPAKDAVNIGSENDYSTSTPENKGLLWFIEKWAQDKWFYNPLCGCMKCMASFHSIYPYWTFMYVTGNVTWAYLAIFPIYVLALSGLNYILNEKV